MKKEIRNQIIKPFLEDIFRQKSENAIYDHPWEIKTTRLETILRLADDQTYKPLKSPEISRREALRREIGKIISNDIEEKVGQLLLMYETYQGSEWEKTDIKNFS